MQVSWVLELEMFQSVGLGSGYADQCVYRNILFRFVHLGQGYSSVLSVCLAYIRPWSPILSIKKWVGINEKVKRM